MGEVDELSLLRRQSASDAQQSGRGCTQFPTGSARGRRGAAQLPAGVFEGAGGVGVRPASAALGDLRDGGEQIGRGPRRVAGRCWIRASGAQVRGRG